MMILSACSDEKKPNEHTLTVVSRPNHNALFYTGTIQPLKSTVVTSPADGTVIEMAFQYGEVVQKGQLLFILSSSKFLLDYKSALMQYIKAKSDFNQSETQLNEAKFLHQNQLISDDDFNTKKAAFYGNQLVLLQSKDALENLINQSGYQDVGFDKLTIADVDKITQMMHLQMRAEHLRIISPAAGVVLFSSRSEDESKKIVKGDSIKQSDVLASIGDMHGLTVRIKANELIVNQLKIGQKVKITGIAFPDTVLIGSISRIDHQGESLSGGLPVFFVEVIVEHLTAAQQNMIHVGMSANVEINIEEPSQISVPIAAIYEKNGASFVNIFDNKTKTSHAYAVKTGKTNMDSVVILSGLKEGDNIVISPRSIN